MSSIIGHPILKLYLAKHAGGIKRLLQINVLINKTHTTEKVTVLCRFCVDMHCNVRLRQNGSHFADGILMSEYRCILFQHSLKCVRKGPIDRMSVLVQIATWLGTEKATWHYLNQVY